MFHTTSAPIPSVTECSLSSTDTDANNSHLQHELSLLTTRHTAIQSQIDITTRLVRECRRNLRSTEELVTQSPSLEDVAAATVDLESINVEIAVLDEAYHTYSTKLSEGEATVSSKGKNDQISNLRNLIQPNRHEASVLSKRKKEFIAVVNRQSSGGNLLSLENQATALRAQLVPLH